MWQCLATFVSFSCVIMNSSSLESLSLSWLQQSWVFKPVLAPLPSFPINATHGAALKHTHTHTPSHTHTLRHTHTHTHTHRHTHARNHARHTHTHTQSQVTEQTQPTKRDRQTRYLRGAGRKAMAVEKARTCSCVPCSCLLPPSPSLLRAARVQRWPQVKVSFPPCVRLAYRLSSCRHCRSQWRHRGRVTVFLDYQWQHELLIAAVASSSLIASDCMNRSPLWPCLPVTAWTGRHCGLVNLHWLPVIVWTGRHCGLVSLHWLPVIVWTGRHCSLVDLHWLPVIVWTGRHCGLVSLHWLPVIVWTGRHCGLVDLHWLPVIVWTGRHCGLVSLHWLPMIVRTGRHCGLVSLHWLPVIVWTGRHCGLVNLHWLPVIVWTGRHCGRCGGDLFA